MGIGIGKFCPGKMGFKPLELGFGHWEWEKMSEIKNGNGIWALWNGISKNNVLGNMIVIPPSGPSYNRIIGYVRYIRLNVLEKSKLGMIDVVEVFTVYDIV